MILISGTAIITRSETRHTGDVEAQTGETLANIEVLISEANLSRHGLPGFGAELHDLAVARVYIKRAVDHAVVRYAALTLAAHGPRRPSQSSFPVRAPSGHCRP